MEYMDLLFVCMLITKLFELALSGILIIIGYEFIDTWIVLLKGRTPIFLQTYHHAGIAIIMWGFEVTANTCGITILALNSFIHTI
jgi:hypothetical protein